jgi:hypothetical protein
MKTQSLLLTAAAVCLGTASAFAVSSNVVGYTSLSLAKGFNLVANTLDNKTGNDVEALFGSLPADSSILRWNGSGFSALNKLDVGPTDWDDVGYALNPGESIFVQASAATTVTLVGEVTQGQLNISLIKGNNFVASKVPQAGVIDTDLGYTPKADDSVYTWNGNGYNAYNNLDGTTSGWDSASGFGPSLAVGQGVIIQSSAAATWGRNFVVN